MTTSRFEHRGASLLHRVALVLVLATALFLGALSTAALGAPRSAPVRPATRTDALQPSRPVPASRPAAAVLPLVLGAIVFLVAFNPAPRPYGAGRY